MALPTNGSTYKALNTSIGRAVNAGRIDPAAQAALISAARKLARVMDEPGWPIVSGKYDNVSPALLLKYCDALGIVPEPQAAAARPRANPLAAQRSGIPAAAKKLLVVNG